MNMEQKVKARNRLRKAFNLCDSTYSVNVRKELAQNRGELCMMIHEDFMFWLPRILDEMMDIDETFMEGYDDINDILILLDVDCLTLSRSKNDECYLFLKRKMFKYINRQQVKAIVEWLHYIRTLGKRYGYWDQDMISAALEHWIPRSKKNYKTQGDIENL